MTLQDIFDHLTYGELSQLAMGGTEEGGVAPQRQVELAMSIQLGLIALYKRFPLSQKKESILFVPGTYSYTLAATDLQKIYKLQTAEGKPVDLNTAGEYSCKVTGQGELEVPIKLADQPFELPDDLKTSGLVVTYQANHPRISMDDLQNLGAEAIPIHLPETHVQALLLYVAARVYTPQAASGNFHSGNNYYARYEAECQRLMLENVSPVEAEKTARLERSGWV